MERRDIEIFLALAQELHFGRTGERLHVCTARVSQTIKKLERRVGAPLFERTSRQVTLTPIGKGLYDDLRPAHEAIDAASRRAAEAGREVRGTLSVGFFGPAAGRFVLAVAEAFQIRYPGCEVHIRESQFADGLGLVTGGTTDLLLATYPITEPGLATSPVVYTEERLPAVSARHPYARRASVSVADLATARILRSPDAVPDGWDAALGPRHTPDGRPVERGPVFATTQEMLALIGAGRGAFRCPPRPPRTTPARTSRTYRSATRPRTSGGSRGARRRRPSGSARSSARRSATRRRAALTPRVSRDRPVGNPGPMTASGRDRIDVAA